MIFSSFQWDLLRAAGSPDTFATFSVNMDFRSIYQINQDQLIVLGYASITGVNTDAASSNLTVTDVRARLIGGFNETYNIVVTETAAQIGVTITPFSGITFNNRSPFKADPHYQILMPPTFVLEFQTGHVAQNAINDRVQFWVSIGYEVILKGQQFL